MDVEGGRGGEGVGYDVKRRHVGSLSFSEAREGLTNRIEK